MKRIVATPMVLAAALVVFAAGYVAKGASRPEAGGTDMDAHSSANTPRAVSPDAFDELRREVALLRTRLGESGPSGSAGGYESLLVAAGTVVRGQNVAPYTMVAGNPARVIARWDGEKWERVPTSETGFERELI